MKPFVVYGAVYFALQAVTCLRRRQESKDCLDYKLFVNQNFYLQSFLFCLSSNLCSVLSSLSTV